MSALLNEPESESAVWTEIAPLLDAALAQLAQKDHDAVVLRFFGGKSFRDVGVALGTTEDSAKMRVRWALEKLQKFFTARGVAVSAAVIAGAVSANSVQAAPTALAKTVTAAAVAKGATASGSTLLLIKGALKIMAWTKAKTAIVFGAAALVVSGVAVATVKEMRVYREDAVLEPDHRRGPGAFERCSAHRLDPCGETRHGFWHVVDLEWEQADGI